MTAQGLALVQAGQGLPTTVRVPDLGLEPVVVQVVQAVQAVLTTTAQALERVAAQVELEELAQRIVVPGRDLVQEVCGLTGKS
jgi:DNA-binding transcriptional regulator YdaS (Cro superfamily)